MTFSLKRMRDFAEGPDSLILVVRDVERTRSLRLRRLDVKLDVF